MSNKPDFLHPENPPSDPLAWLIKWVFIFRAPVLWQAGWVRSHTRQLARDEAG